MTYQELIEKYGLEGIAKANFRYFFVKVLGLQWAPHFDEWQWLIENHKRFLLMCARGHGKTVFITGYAIWLVYTGKPVDILFLSFSEEQVKLNIMNKIEEIINKNPYLVHLRPQGKQLWGAQLKTFGNGSLIRGESFGSSIRGAHPDYIFEDDPLKDKGGMTPEEQFQYHMTVVSGMAKENSVLGIIGTPLDNDDLLEQVERLSTYTVRKYPAIKEDGEPLFPQLYSKAYLKRIELENSFAWSREYMLQRVDPKTQVFADKWRVINEFYSFPEQLAVLRTIIDPAISEKENACDSAITTVGVDYKSHKWEYETELVHADNPSKIMDAILKQVATHMNKCPDYAIVIESELFQKVLANDLKQIILERNLNVRVIEVAHSGIQGKHERIIGLQNAWEARAIHLLPQSPLIPQFRYYRPGVRGVKIDGIDAFSWIRHEDVAVPIVNAQVYDPGVPDDASA